MKVIVVSGLAVLLLAVLAAFVLDTQQITVADSFTTQGVRLGDPGGNLVDWR